MKERHKALSLQQRVKLDDLLLIQLQFSQLHFISFLLFYWPLEEAHGPNTHLFSDCLEFLNPGIVVCYPKTNLNEFTIQAVQTNDDTRFRKNQYNIYEPELGDLISPASLDIIFVPLLTFDKKGIRVGYGKGFYDRFLANCRKDCLKIGFSYFEPFDSIDDTREFDLPLDLCITPTTVYAF